MAKRPAVIEPQLIEQLLIGLLPPSQAEPLIKQLEDDPDLAAIAEHIDFSRDTIVSAMQTPTPVDLPRSIQIASIVQRLEQAKSEALTPSEIGTINVVAKPAAAVLDFLSPPQSAHELGRLGHFRILDVLGQGGWGVVLEAEDPHLRRHVAIKVMKRDMLSSPEARERFLREARSTAAVEHPNVVAIHHVGQDNGVVYLVMPLLQGETLEAYLKRNPKPPLAETLRIAKEIVAGLAAAHARGLVHRDIKPGNIFLMRNRQEMRNAEFGIRNEEPTVARGANKGSDNSAFRIPHSAFLDGSEFQVKVLDFGLARPVDDVSISQDGTIIGTPQYMAPEQANAEMPDHRCDLFSLGVVLYQMTTGKLPFTGKSILNILASLASHEPPPPSQEVPTMPAALSDLIVRLLEKKPERRPRSAAAVGEELDRINCEPTGETPWVMPASKGKKERPRSRKWIASGLTALALALMGVVVIIKTPDGDVKIDLPAGFRIEVEKGIISIMPHGIDRKTEPVARGTLWQPTIATPGPSPLDNLRAESMPADKRVPNLPKEVVAVIGTRITAEKGDPLDHIHALASTEYLSGLGVLTDRWVALPIRNQKSLQVGVWDLTGVAPRRLHGPSDNITWAGWAEADKKRLIAVQAQGDLRTFEMAGNRLAASNNVLLPKAQSIWFTPDGRYGIALDGPRIRRVNMTVSPPTSAYFDTGTNAWPIFSPDGSRFAAFTSPSKEGVAPSELRIFDIASAQFDRVATIPNTNWWTYPKAYFGNDGKTVAISGGQETQFWDVASNPPKLVIRRETGALHNVSFSPDGLYVVGCRADRGVPALVEYTWPNLQQTREWNLPDSPEAHVARAYHLDARHLIALNSDGTAFVMRLTATTKNSDREAAVWLLGRTEGFRNIAVLPEGQQRRDVSKVEDLPKGEFQVVSVHVEGDWVKDADVARIAKFPHLVELKLQRTGKLTDESLRLLTATKLQFLIVNYSPFTGAGLAHLKNIPTLKSLHFFDTEITDRDLAQLAAFPELDGVAVSSSHLTAEGIQHLARISGLRGVLIANARPGQSDRQMEDVVKACPELRELLIYGAIGDEGVKAISRLKHLRLLLLDDGAQVTDAGLAQLIAAQGTLRTLTIERSPKVTAAGIEKLKAALPNCTIRTDVK